MIVHIPKSDEAPTQNATDKKYYARVGETMEPMWHWQIADMFGRQPQPILKPVFTIINDVNEPDLFVLDLSIRNVGKSIAKHAFIRVGAHGLFRSKQYHTAWFDTSHIHNTRDFYVCRDNQVIHPGIKVSVEKYKLAFTQLNLDSLPSNTTFILEYGSESSATKQETIVLPLESFLSFKDGKLKEHELET